MTLFDIEYDDFKREDTTNVIAITLYTDDKQPITPDSSHTWKAKVSKADKYVGEYPVTISGNTIKLSSSNLTRLPNGDYGLELWETYSGSTTIYPSAGVMEFRVHRNANDTLGTVDPTTDINAIIDDLHKAGQNIKVVATNTLSPGSKASVTQSITNGENQLTFNIPQGPKGEQGIQGPAPTLKIGTVTKLNPDQAPTANLSGGDGSYTLDLGIPQGVQGETNATATNALNVANSVNSKVTAIQTNGGGRNLLVGTGTATGDVASGSGTFVKGAFNGYDAVKTNKAYDERYINMKSALGRTNAKAGDWVTLSVYVKADKQINDGYLSDYRITGTSATSNDSPFHSIAMADKPITTQWQQYSWSFQINDTSLQRQNTRIEYAKDTGDNWIYWAGWMLETGTVAHDWSPAPEDIQTQLDALKEAVKKLGGDNLAPLVAPVMRKGGTDTESIIHGHAQRFALPLGEVELLPNTDILVDVLSGDTLSQSFVIETDATSVNGTFTFFMNDSANHHIVPFDVQQLTATKYLVSASYTAEKNGKWRILDIMRLKLTGGTYVEFSNPYAAIDLSGGGSTDQPVS